MGFPEDNLGKHFLLSSPFPPNLLSSWRGPQVCRGQRWPAQVPAEEEPTHFSSWE